MAEPSDTIGALAPALYWKLDEASGTSAANSGSSGSGDAGTLSGGATFGATTILDGPTDTSLALDGVDGYAYEDTSPLQGDTWTLVAFFQTAQVTGRGYLVNQVASGGEQLKVWVDCDTGELNVELWSSDGLQEAALAALGVPDAATAVNDGLTHLVQISHNASQQIGVWLDGYELAGPTGGFLDGTLGGADGSRTDAPALELGRSAAADDYLDGFLSHVAVFLSELDGADANAIWTAGGFAIVEPTYGLPWDEPVEPEGPDEVATATYGLVDGSSVPDGPAGVELGVYGELDLSSVPDGPAALGITDHPASVDGSSVPDGPVAMGRVYELGGVDGGASVPGPSLAFTSSVPDPFLPAAYVDLVDTDCVTVLARLDEAFGITWQDQESGQGIGAVSLMRDNVWSSELREGRFIRCWLYDGEVFTWRVETVVRNTIVQDEESGETVDASGRGWVTTWDTAKVYPAGGVTARPAVPSRVFNFASPDYPLAGWTAAYVVQAQGTLGAVWRRAELSTVVPAPAGWLYQLRSAKWIWSRSGAASVGKSYFRTTFTLGAQTAVVIAATGDNLWTLYLNGVPLLGDNANASAWAEYRKAGIVLPAGTYTLGAVVENLGGAGGFLCAVYTEDSDGFVDTIVKVTDGTWLANDAPTVEPGWTAGQIVRQLLMEAQARDQLTAWSVDFTDTVDSDGTPWEPIPEFQVEVGDGLESVLEQLHEQGWVDFAAAPAAPVLRLWVHEGQGQVARSAEFVRGVNIVDGDHGQAQPAVNRLLVRYGAGMFVLDDTASQTALGMILEGFLTLDTADETEARRLAQRALDQASGQELAMAFGISPRGDTPDRPYADFSLGDTVLAPDADDVSTRVRVLSITVSVDDESGEADLALELNRRTIDQETVRTDLLRALGSGVVGDAPGSRPVASTYDGGGAYQPTRAPSSLGDIAPSWGSDGGPLSTSEVIFDYTGFVDELLESDPWEAPYNLTVAQVILRPRVVVTGSAVAVELNGVEFTIGPSTSRAEYAPEGLTVLAGSALVATLTDVGGGDMEGLAVIVRYRPT